MSSTPTVLVTCATGKTGNIGGHVALTLHRFGGFRIRIGARNVEKAQALFRDTIPDATYVRLDLSNPATYAAALSGVDRVFLGHPEHGFDTKEVQQGFMDAVSNASSPPPYVVKFTATIRPEAAKAFFLHAPLLGPQIKNTSEVIDAFKKKHGPKSLTVVEGCSWFFQTYTSHYRDMVGAGCLMVGNDNALIPRIDSRDIAEAAATCLRDQNQHGGKLVVLTGGEMLRETDVCAIITKQAKKKVRYCRDPTPLKSFIEKEKIPDLGAEVTMWDLLSQLWAVEKHYVVEDKGQPSPPLQPQTFEELTGRRYRTFADFAKEHAAEWKKASMVSFIIRIIAATNSKCRDESKGSCFRPAIKDVDHPQAVQAAR